MNDGWPMFALHLLLRGGVFVKNILSALLQSPSTGLRSDARMPRSCLWTGEAYCWHVKLNFDDLIRAGHNFENSTPHANSAGLPAFKISFETQRLLTLEASRLKVDDRLLVTALLWWWRNPSEDETASILEGIQKVPSQQLTEEITLSPIILDSAGQGANLLDIGSANLTTKAGVLFAALLTDWLREPEDYRRKLAADYRRHLDDQDRPARESPPAQ